MALQFAWVGMAGTPGRDAKWARHMMFADLDWLASLEHVEGAPPWPSRTELARVWGRSVHRCTEVVNAWAAERGRGSPWRRRDGE